MRRSATAYVAQCGPTGERTAKSVLRRKTWPPPGGVAPAPGAMSDDDPVLSLILSKAFLLANDTAIDDQSITRQIGR